MLERQRKTFFNFNFLTRYKSKLTLITDMNTILSPVQNFLILGFGMIFVSNSSYMHSSYAYRV